MKIAIITITDGMNYGNRLQNYALQLILESMGHYVETIRLRSSRDVSGITKTEKVFKDSVKHVIHRSDTEFFHRKREKRFYTFNNSYISFADHGKYFDSNFEIRIKDYDAVVCGSDQIWNVRYDFIAENIEKYLGKGAKRKIAYAASFGISELPENYKSVFQSGLQSFESIGIREAAGQKLIGELTGRKDVSVVLDPTMLPEIDSWKGFMRKPGYMKNGQIFVVTYFLSGRNSKIKAQIQRVCEDMHAEPVNLDIEYLQDNRIENKDVFLTDPREFVWLIANSKAVLTDSFHAAVFSIIFNRPFVVYQRNSIEENNHMESRLETLLEKFHLSDFIDDIDSPMISPRNYSSKNIDDILENERKNSLDFLKKALEINEN